MQQVQPPSAGFMWRVVRSYSSDTFLVERSPPGHSVSRADRKLAGSAASMFDLHSNMPPAAVPLVEVVLCCSRPAGRQERRSDSAPGERNPCKVRRRVACLSKGRLITAAATV